MDKDFTGWHALKVRLDGRREPPSFQERDVWWCSIGVNVGYEVYGKGYIFTRPVVIIRKFSRYTFLGVPLTTKIKDRPHYYRMRFQEKDVCAMLHQMKALDSRRLADKMGRLPVLRYKALREAIQGII